MNNIGIAYDIRTKAGSPVRIVSQDFGTAARGASMWFAALTPEEQDERGSIRGLNWVQDGVIIDNPPVPVTAIAILTQPADITAAGEVTQFTAVAVPNGADIKTVRYTSTDEDVAKIDATGLVTPIASGTVAFIASTIDGGYSVLSHTISVSGV